MYSNLLNRLTLILILLLPVSGWADGWPVYADGMTNTPSPSDSLCFSIEGTEVSCDGHAYDARAGTWPIMPNCSNVNYKKTCYDEKNGFLFDPHNPRLMYQSCYQRMQEALTELYENRRYRVDRRTRKTELIYKLETGKAEDMLDVTMAECVRGK